MPPAPPAQTDAVSVAFLYRSLWRYARGARGQLLASTGLLIGAQLLRLAVPWLSAQAINALQLGGASALRSAAGWVGVVVVVQVLTWMLHGPGRVLERIVSVRVRQSLSDALYDKLSRAPLAWHERHHSGELQHRVAQSTQALYSFAQSQFVYLQSGVGFVGPVVALALLSPTSGLIATAGYVVVGFIVVRFDRALMRLAADENQAERRYASALLEFLGHMATVIGLRVRASTRRLLAGRLGAVFAPLRRSIVLSESKWFAVDMVSLVLTWGLVAHHVWQTQAAGATVLIGSVFMIYQYAQQAAGVLSAMAGNLQGLARSRADFASADEVWRAPEQPEPLASLPADWQRVVVRGLNFSHGPVGTPGPAPTVALPPSPEPPAARGGLHEVGLVLERGARLALVGPSGGGKSTLMRVLAGLYEAQSGELEVDGQPVAPQAAGPAVGALAAEATLIPQEADVFEATVRQNLCFDLERSEAQLAKALHTAAFDTVLARLPQGLETTISERGFNLSGGQRQRLCLARGVIAAEGSSLLMLDEPTSALDPVTEAAILDRLHEHFPQACLIASVHRMSLLGHFDSVVLMEAGRVVDVGTPEALLARQPLFRSLMRTAPDREADANDPPGTRPRDAGRPPDEPAGAA